MIDLTLIDGGDIPTLSSLYILQRLLFFIRREEIDRDRQEGLAPEGFFAYRLPLACDYFSFIFGSGFGG